MIISRWLLYILILGLAGTVAELLVSGHTESGPQWIPLVLLAAAIPAMIWPGPNGRWLRGLWWLFVVSGIVGVALHLNGRMEFQAESERGLGGWALFWKSFDSKTPPVLAPGAMVQLGLLGFAYQAAARAAKTEKGNTL